MQTITINRKTYDYVVDYKNDTKLRNSLNMLTKKEYGFDFEDWYLGGYWGDYYVPYSLVHGDTIIANISVNIINFLVKGEKRSYIQIGTVLTEQKYRNQGLSSALLAKVLAEWRGKCDLIYLFANDSVLDFYPKFGFRQADEYQYSKKVVCEDSQADVTKLDMSDKENKNFLRDKISQSFPLSLMSVLNNPSITMFYYTAFLADNVHYVKALDAIAIADVEQDTLHLKAVFSANKVSLDGIIAALINTDITRVVLGFTPLDKTSFDERVLKSDDALFILDDRWGLFDNENEKIQFPVLSHA
jgi:GNAT superfamily N-acetyltransferase